MKPVTVLEILQDYHNLWEATYDCSQVQNAATVDVPVSIMDPDQ